ncbi:hypothetical protein GF325_00950, partial [Candidatus Bathyarchaeota archaeon]|nr:hypothetical protein [Candidatus Bathyarchaeota archaeon]
MELDGFGYNMKEFIGIFMGELLRYRVKIKGKTKDVKTKDPNTGAKVVVGNEMVLIFNKMKMLCQATRDKDYLQVQLAPHKKNQFISDEFIDIVNNCLESARQKLIEKQDKREADFESVVLTKLSALTVGSGGPTALECKNCGAPLPPKR